MAEQRSQARRKPGWGRWLRLALGLALLAYVLSAPFYTVRMALGLVGGIQYVFVLGRR